MLMRLLARSPTAACESLRMRATTCRRTSQRTSQICCVVTSYVRARADLQLSADPAHVSSLDSKYLAPTAARITPEISSTCRVPVRLGWLAAERRHGGPRLYGCHALVSRPAATCRGAPARCPSTMSC